MERHTTASIAMMFVIPRFRFLVLATVISFLGALTFGGVTAALETFPSSRLAISSAGKTHSFTVELAATESRRTQGLMWRRHLATDRGMLFIYAHDQVLQMWMKNTLIPLDMLFIGRGGIIVAIHERAVPRSLRIISSGRRVRAVLELNGGTASRLGLRPGDKVLHQAFGTR